MNEVVEYLDTEDLIDLARVLLGDPPPIRDVGLLGSAAARPATEVFGREAYPDLASKAAALLQSIVGNHSLIDGNNRLAWLAPAVFLEFNGVSAHEATNDDVFAFVVWVAAESPDLAAVTTGLRRIVNFAD